MSAFDLEGAAVQVKGTPRGIRTLSHKAKALVVLGLVSVCGLIAFAALSTDEAMKGGQKDTRFGIAPALPADDLEKLAADQLAAKASADQLKAQAKEDQKGRPAAPPVTVADLARQSAGVAGHDTSPAGTERDPEAEAARRREIERLQRLSEALSADVDADGGRTGGADSAVQGGGVSPGAGKGLESLLGTMPSRLATPAPTSLASASGFESGAAGDRGPVASQGRRDAFAARAGAVVEGAKLTAFEPSGPCEVKAGSVIPAVLQRSGNSDLPGTLTAMVSENVYDSLRGTCLAIPQGSMLRGTYDSDVAVGETRLFVVWQTLRLPDGRTLDLKGMGGSDQAGLAGITGAVDNHYGKIFGSAVLMSLLSAGVQLSQPRNDTGTVNGSYGQSAQQVASAALGQQLGQAGLQVLQRNLSIKPTIKVFYGTRFVVDVKTDIALPGPSRY